MRALYLTLVLCLVACPKNDTTAPPADVAGNYSLQTVHAQPLPFDFPVDSFLFAPDTIVVITRWTDNTVILQTTGRIEEHLGGTATHWSSSVPTHVVDNWTDFYTGRWTATSNSVLIVFDSLAVDGGTPAVLGAPIRLTFGVNGDGTLAGHYSYRHSSLGPAPASVDYPLVYRKQ